jgi:hypothetical protein
VGARTYDLDVSVKVGDEEEVETAAGKMRGIRIEREARWKQRGSDNAGLSTSTYWYNSAVKRYVLAEFSTVTASGKVLVRERQELVSYAVK